MSEWGLQTVARDRFRWVILASIFLLSFSAFIERLTLSVVAERMMPELGLTQVQIGWLFSAFIAGYTAFQFPGGIVGLRFGAHRVLFLSTVFGIFASLALIVAPILNVSGSVLTAMLASRFILGVVQAPLYPVSSGALVAWFPPTEWAWALGLLVTGIGLGAAVTPPAVAWLMQIFGWKAGVCIATIPAAVAAALWWRVGRALPHNAAPTAPLRATAATSPAGRSAQLWRDAWALACNRNVIALTLSYVLENSVVYLITYWSFLYLIQERHFTVLESGTLAAIPFLVGAAAAGVGGRLCDRCCEWFGPLWGVRIIPLIALPSVSALLFLAVQTANPYMAVAALTACYSGLQMTEGSYWCAAMRIGRERTMAATGVLNTGGNLGGILMTPIVAYLSGLHNWTACFMIAAGCACCGAALWLFVDPTAGDQRLTPAPVRFS
jgi:ACS family glucarate transporter-like MFS transporter